MSLIQGLLHEYDHEMATTRVELARVPEDKLDYRPHPKSFTLARLAGHIAEIPMWAVMTLAHDEFDVAPADGPAYESLVATSSEQLLAAFDANVAAAREQLAATPEERLFTNWSLLKGGQPVLTMLKVGCLRSFVMNHLIHHRGQLGVYLRLLDVPVPVNYGPTADEGQF